MLTITSSRSSRVDPAQNAATASPAPARNTIPLIGAANNRKDNNDNSRSGSAGSARSSIASTESATPLRFTFDEAFSTSGPPRDGARSVTAGAQDAVSLPSKYTPSLRARFVSAFVLAPRKLLLDRISSESYKKPEMAVSHDHPQTAPCVLKRAARDVKAILVSLDKPMRYRTNDKQRQHVKDQLSDTVKRQLYGTGKLSVDQRVMLYALPQIKTWLARFNQDFAYGDRTTHSSRRLLFERTVSVVQALDGRVARMEKLLVDTYMQHEHHAPSGAVLSALLEPESVGRLLEITAGLDIEQHRAAALGEIKQVCQTLGKHRPDAAHLASTLFSVSNLPSRHQLPAVAPPKPPRMAANTASPSPSPSPSPAPSTSTSTSNLPSSSTSSSASPSTQSHLSRSEAFQQLLSNFPNYANLRERSDSASSAPIPPLRHTRATQTDCPAAQITLGTVSTLGTLMGKFRSFFSAARKSCTPDWESRTVARQWQAQRMQAAAVAYDKITDQATAILLALNGTTERSSDGAHAREGEATSPDANHAHADKRIAGPALDALLRTSNLTLDLGRQLSLHALLSASDSHTLQLATTYDMDAIHALQAGGRLRPDQRGLLYGLDALVNAFAKLPSVLKQPGSMTGAKFDHASRALAELVHLQCQAHDTLTYICVTTNLAAEERVAIFNDRTVAQVMEATAGQPADRHNAICQRIVESARQTYRDPELTSQC